jgi:hypothetical protein
VRDVVGDEDDPLGVEAGQGLGEELGGAARVLQAQRVPGVVQAHVAGRPGEPRVEGVGDGVQVAGPQARLFQAPAGGQFGQLPRGERQRSLAVLAPAEALLLGGRHRLAVDDESCGRVVEQGVDTEDAHGLHPELWGVLRRLAGCRTGGCLKHLETTRLSVD